MNELYLAIGGFSIRLRSEDLSFVRLSQAYEPFLVDERGPSDMEVVVDTVSDATRARSADLDLLRAAIVRQMEARSHRGAGGAEWVEQQVALGQRLLASPGFVDALRAYHPREGKWRSFFLSSTGAWFLDEEAREARLYLNATAGTQVARQLGGYLTSLLSLSLIEQDGLVLHAAGVVDDEDAYVFMGPSGSGKTTIARAARERGWPVLADDRLIVRRMGGGQFRAFRTPWNMMGSPRQGNVGLELQSAPARAVFFPRHGKVDRWVCLGPVAGLVRLVEGAFPALRLFEGRNPARVLELLAEISRGVPCYELWFSISCDFLGQIKELG